MVATLFFFEETYMRYDRPQPQSPRVLREAMQTLWHECFPGCLFSETTINKRTNAATYSCMIYINRTVVVKFFFWNFLKTRRHVIAQATLERNEPNTFEIEMPPQSNEVAYRRILETLYSAIDVHNHMYTQTQ